jgi:hypothetical protein
VSVGDPPTEMGEHSLLHARVSLKMAFLALPPGQRPGGTAVAGPAFRKKLRGVIRRYAVLRPLLIVRHAA